MAGVLTTDQKAAQRTPGQWSRPFLAIPEYHTIYTAHLSVVPATNDMVAQISFNTGSGTLANVLADMTLYVGTTAGGYDLGMCRIRKAPIAGTFYIGETSEILWDTAGTIYLTVVDDFGIWQKSIRLSAGIPLMDWDITYTDQHEDFDPIPCMGGHRVGKLTGASVAVLLGPAPDTLPSVFDSTISGQLWSVAGATLDDATDLNPEATFTAPGTYLAYCTFTAANGKTAMGVIYVIIYDDDNPLIGDFLLGDGTGSGDSGGVQFSVTLYNRFSTSDIRKRSLVILCTEDYAERAAITLPGQIPGAENIICAGWISNIDNARTRETKDITFTVEGGEYWLRQIRDYPSGLQLQNTADYGWINMPGLTVGRACWHFLHWRSTATKVMDVQITGDTKYSTRFQTARANLWERLVQVAGPTIFARPIVDNFGRLFIDVEPQMVPVIDRDFPEAMTITDDDIEGDIAWTRRDVPPLALLFFSGISVDSSGTALSFFSMWPGHSYPRFGQEEPQDNYLVEDQSNANDLCGLYAGWRNNPIDNMEITFAHSMRYATIAPRQYFDFEISALHDPRGIGYTGRMIPRAMRFRQDPSTKFISFSVTFEPESFPLEAINGDIPSMAGIDFSTPDFSIPTFGGILPFLPTDPLFELPPSLSGANCPPKLILGSSTHGVAYTENANETDPAKVLWKFMNAGLDSGDKTGIDNMIITPSGAIFMCTNNTVGDPRKGTKRIYWAAGLGSAWNLLYDAASNGNWWVTGIGFNPNKAEEIGFHTAPTFVTSPVYPDTKFYIGSRSGYGSANLIPHVHGTGPFGIREWRSGIVFSAGHWAILGSRAGGFASFSIPMCIRMTSSGVYVDENEYSGAIERQRFGVCPGAADKIIAWEALGSEVLTFLTNNATTEQIFTNADTDVLPQRIQELSMSQSGQNGMGTDDDTSTHPLLTTTDLAFTWSAPGSALLGVTVFEMADDQRGVMAGGINVYFSPDLGASWVYKTGNLGYIAPLINITNLRVVP